MTTREPRPIGTSHSIAFSVGSSEPSLKRSAGNAAGSSSKRAPSASSDAGAPLIVPRQPTQQMLDLAARQCRERRRGRAQRRRTQQAATVQVGVELSQVRAQGCRRRLGIAGVEERLDLPESQASLTQRQGLVKPGDLAGTVAAVPGRGPGRLS